MPNGTTSTGSVFVSYAHDDLDRVRNLLDRLSGVGFEVWWDDDLTIGSSFREQLDAALARASCLFVVWTQVSVTRPWVLDEVSRVADKGIVLPVVLDAGLKIPLGFGQMEFAKLEGWTGGDHPELTKLISSVGRLVAHGPAKQDMPTLAGDTTVIANSNDIVFKLQHLTFEVRRVGDVLAPSSPETAALRGALDEVSKTYRAVNSAILRFKMQAIQSTISAEPFLTLETSGLRSEIAKGRGHCHQIWNYYVRSGGVRESIARKVNEGTLTLADAKAVDVAFDDLGTGDMDLFEPLEKIGELLSNESRAVANLLLAGQEAVARQRILDGRLKLQPFEDKLAEAILELQKTESSLGYVTP